MFRLKYAYVFLAILLLGMTFVSLMSVSADNSSSSGTQTTTSSGSSTSSTDGTNTQSHDNSTDNGVPDQIETEQQRSVQVQLDNSTNQVEIQSVSRNGNVTNKIHFELNAHEQIQMELTYQSNSNGNQTNLKISMDFKRLIEFIDNTTNVNNTVGGLDAADTILKVIDFNTINWTLSYTTTTISNQTLYTISVIGQTNGATIQFNFHLASSFVQLSSGNILQPTAVKIDVIISNYVYNTSNSQLALQTNIKSTLVTRAISNTTEDQRDHLTSQSESGINFGSGQYGGFFSWANQLLVDGKNMSVVSSPVMTDPEDSSGQTTMLYYSFPHGNQLVWDPRIGIAMSSPGINLNSAAFNPTPSSSTTNTPGFEFITALAVLPIFGVAVLYLRRNTKKD